MGRRTLVTLVVGLGAVSSAGCGGSGGSKLSTAYYKAKIAAIGKEANRSQSSIEAGLKSNSTAALATALATFATAEEKMSKEVGDLNPPKNAQDANDELAKGLQDISAATSEILPQAKSAANVSAAVALLNKSNNGVKAGKEVDDALGKLQKLGYAPAG